MPDDLRTNPVTEAITPQMQTAGVLAFEEAGLNNKSKLQIAEAIYTAMHAARPTDPEKPIEGKPMDATEERDADGLDPIEALIADACAAEGSRNVHEGGDYYAERIVRRAIAQGTLKLARSEAMTDSQQPARRSLSPEISNDHPI